MGGVNKSSLISIPHAPQQLNHLQRQQPLKFVLQAPVDQTLASAIHWINHYRLDISIGFASVYPLDSDLSGGRRYPSFEQLGPECSLYPQEDSVTEGLHCRT